jgi:hypothetical protein
MGIILRREENEIELTSAQAQTLRLWWIAGAICRVQALQLVPLLRKIEIQQAGHLVRAG